MIPIRNSIVKTISKQIQQYYEVVLIGLLGILLIGVAWLFGGVRTGYLLPLAGLSVVLLIPTLVGGWAGRFLVPVRVSPGIALWWRDPVFYWGLYGLGFLGLQWLNSGRVPFYDVGQGLWRYTEPRWPAFPFAFYRADAFQMLLWFFPAWTIALCVRSPVIGQAGLMRLTRGLVYSAGLLSAVGVGVYFFGSKAMFGMASGNDHYYASFGYANHAAAFFVMMEAISCGLILRMIFRGDRAIRWWRLMLLVLTMLSCLIGAHFSLSRGGVILAWGVVIAAGIFVGFYGARRMACSRYVIWLCGSGIVLVLLAALILKLSGPALGRQFRRSPGASTVPGSATTMIDLSLGERRQFVGAAVNMWRDYPWYGVGGWGFRRLVAHYLPRDKWYLLDEKRPGWANVHQDALQFLVEFGVMGIAGLLGVLVALGWEWGRVKVASHSFTAMGFVGLAGVGVASLIDLPFRCPAILWTWTYVLAASPRLVSRPTANPE